MVVVGDKVATTLFGDESAVGKKVKVNDRQFTVVGVLEKKGGQMMGVSQDSVVIMPITTYQTRLFPGRTVRGEDAISELAIEIDSTKVADIVSADTSDLLMQRHRITQAGKEDFLIMTQEQMLGMVQQVTGILTIVLGAIASISLIVGSHRYYEHHAGFRNRAYAGNRHTQSGRRQKRRDILLQFLLEAAMLSLTGGIIGI